MKGKQMIDFLKTWANQIIVAVIIATIIEMLLPNGKNKKYIKMVIGLYVLFVVIEPIITKVTGKNIEISNFNYKKYFDENVIETSTNKFEDNNSKLIKQAYIDNIKNDIKIKVENKGYKVANINIDILENENLDTYGTIKNISLSIEKLKEETKEEEINEEIAIKNVDININNTSNATNNTTSSTQENNGLSEKEKIEIIEYLANEYSVDKKNIVIN